MAATELRDKSLELSSHASLILLINFLSRNIQTFMNFSNSAVIQVAFFKLVQHSWCSGAITCFSEIKAHHISSCFMKCMLSHKKLTLLIIPYVYGELLEFMECFTYLYLKIGCLYRVERTYSQYYYYIFKNDQSEKSRALRWFTEVVESRVLLIQQV